MVKNHYDHHTVSSGVVGSNSGKSHYCPDVSHVMSNSDLSGLGQ